MSAEKNKAILELAMTNFGSLEKRANYFELYDPNCVLHGYAGVEPGMESIKQFYHTIWAAFPDSYLTWEDPIAEGDKVAVSFVMHATHQGDFMGIPATGKKIALTGCTILRFTNGKCVERWSQADFLGMLQQLGAVPMPEQ